MVNMEQSKNSNIINNQELFDIVTKHLKSGTPIAVSRYGDGEHIAVMMSNDIPYIKHLGYVPSNEHKQKMSENIIRSIKESDIICISNNKRKKWNVSKRYFMELANEKLIGDADYHTDFLVSGKLDILLRNSKRLFFISGHDLESNFRNRYCNKHGLENIKKIIIPKQAKYFPNQSRRHYPEVFTDVCAKLKIMNLDGYFCLVGAGFIGKMYMPLIRDAGGVVLDIGSVFDRLAGFLTRGVRGITREDKKFKL